MLEPAAERGAKTRRNKVAPLGAGSVDLVLTSPPYGRDIQMIDKPAWIAGGSLGAKDSRNYSSDRDNLGHARGQPGGCHRGGHEPTASIAERARG